MQELLRFVPGPKMCAESVHDRFCGTFPLLFLPDRWFTPENFPALPYSGEDPGRGFLYLTDFPASCLNCSGPVHFSRVFFLQFF